MRLPLARALVASALVTVSFAMLTTAARAADSTLQVVAVGLGNVEVTPAPKASVRSDGNPDACPDPISIVTGSRTEMQASSCRLTYEAGTQVTLTATGGDDGDGPATTFRRWSDERCPAGNQCTLTLGAAPESISALFSPQRVSVVLSDAGSVTSTPAGVKTFLGDDCVSPADGAEDCSGDFDVDLPAPVALTASGTNLRWLDPAPGGPVLCDTVTAGGTTCNLAALWPRWGSVGFNGFDPLPAIPPKISVLFHVRKTGEGSGTVRGDLLDCGSECTADRTFGDSQSLQAVPDSGSRFAGWRGACGDSPTCRLAVGPVTAVTAVFERATSQSGPTTGPTPTPSPRTSRLVKLNVRGHGRKRAILMRVELGGPASVRARLLRGRRLVTARRWQLKAGSYLLRMNVPARVRPGRYRVGLTVSGGGQTQQITRPVRLRR
jgi:List-Bact-rpt repeat protein